MLPQIGPAIRFLLLWTLITGLLYPAAVTALCQALFPHQANGSLVIRNSAIVGSSLIGQDFHSPAYFHPRPSAAGNQGYDPANSGGSNLGPTSQALLDRTSKSLDRFRVENPEAPALLPSDLLTASASGLDPDLSPASALVQAPRVARARGATAAQITQLITLHITPPQWGFLGEPRVNVLALNLDLDLHFPKGK